MIRELFQTFRVSIRSSTTAIKWLKGQGIDPDTIEVGLDSGRHHLGKSESYLQECLRLGILKQNGTKGYRSFAKGQLVFPLKDENGEIVNLYAHPMRKEGPGQYLVENKGIYPKYPTHDTCRIIIAEHMLDAAKASEVMDGVETVVMALDEGMFTERHQIALMRSVELTEILFTEYFSSAIRGHVEQFVTEHIGISTFGTYEFKEAHQMETSLFPEPSDDKGTVKDNGTVMDTSDPQRIILEHGDLQLMVLGGVPEKLDELKVTLRITRQGNRDAGYRDTVNLYNRGRVTELIVQAAEILLVETTEMQAAIETMTRELERYRELHHELTNAIRQPYGSSLSAQRKQSALEHLSGDGLFGRIQNDLQHIGVTGELHNLTVLLLAMTSRKLHSPLNVVMHAKSGAGKSVLMETVAKCIPDEDYMEITSISQKSLYHWDEHSLSHKVLLIQDWYALDPEIEYIIREIQSKRKVSRILTVRDRNNALQSVLKEVHGPVSVISATTKDSIYEDNANRSIQLYLDEDTEQDRRIVERQLNMAAGKVDFEMEEATRQRFRDAQAMIGQYPIINPYAPYIKLPQDVQHIRRVVPIYLSLIESITLLHQYQRKKEIDRLHRKEHLVTDIRDIEIANELMTGLLVSRTDMLPMASREHLERLKDWLKKNSREEFHQRELIRGLRVNPSTVKRHTRNLLEMGYLTVTGGDRYKKGFSYRVTDTGDYDRMRQQVTESLENSMAEIRHRFT